MKVAVPNNWPLISFLFVLRSVRVNDHLKPLSDLSRVVRGGHEAAMVSEVMTGMREKELRERRNQTGIASFPPTYGGAVIEKDRKPIRTSDWKEWVQ